jgi:hypothetical protein
VKRLIVAALALAAFVPLALAWVPPPVDSFWPFDYNTFRQFDVGDIPAGDRYNVWTNEPLPFMSIDTITPRHVNPRWCGDLLVGPPGHQAKALPYAQLWGFARIHLGTGPSAQLFYRWRTWYPGDESRIYHGPWLPFMVVGPDSFLHYEPIWNGDTLGWFNDIEFAAAPGMGNDSTTRFDFVVVRRTWK